MNKMFLLMRTMYRKYNKVDIFLMPSLGIKRHVNCMNSCKNIKNINLMFFPKV